jgi:hypothetical protein
MQSFRDGVIAVISALDAYIGKLEIYQWIKSAG